jgi:uncharacterized lipoprotein YmbA
LRPTITKLTLDVDVQQLEAQFGQYARLKASWSATVFATGQESVGTRVTTCPFQADEKIHPGYAEMVEGYQHEIAALAESVIDTLTSAVRASEAACQKSIAGSGGGSGLKEHNSPMRG